MEPAEALARRKAALRRRIGGLRADALGPVPGSASDETRRRAGEAVARHVAALPELVAAPRVGLYAGLPDELPTRPLFDAVRRAGKPVLLPRLRPGGPAPLEFCRVTRWEDLRPGRYGVLEPGPEVAVEVLAEEDLVLVPGVAFDRRGRRLGRGKGYYDRTFPPGARGPQLFGLAFAFQVVEAVPSGAHDRRVEGVVTEAGLLRAEASPEGRGESGERA